METTNEVGDLAYAFFSAIPAEKWLSGSFHYVNSVNIYGSDGEYAFTSRTQTSCALGHLSNAIAEDCSHKTKDEDETIEQMAGQELETAVRMLGASSIPSINDNGDRRYKHGKTSEGARLNIMHAMLDVRAMHLAAFYGELDEMMDVAKAQIKEAVTVVTGVSFEDLMGKDAHISETTVTLEKQEIETQVRVVAGYTEETVRSL